MAGSSVALEIRDLRFSYPDGTPALRGVDLSVCEGERLGLVGANGAGKSTLLLHPNGLLRGSGSIAVGGFDVTERNLKRIREQVGLVFQNPDDQLFMPTVFDEVAYAALNASYGGQETEERVARALARVGMAGHEHKHPANLSLGQKKRVAIASVIVTDNRLLILDEPSAGLDPAGHRALIHLLSDFKGTMLIAAHDLALIEALCGRVAVMREGRIARVGPSSEVLADIGFLAECGL